MIVSVGLRSPVGYRVHVGKMGTSRRIEPTVATSAASTFEKCGSREGIPHDLTA